MLQLTRIAAGRSLFGRLFAPAGKASGRIKHAPLSQIGVTQQPASVKRIRPRLVLRRAAAILATLAFAAPAGAQVMTITGATPSTFSGPGETITFHVSLGGSNAVTNSVELTRIAYGTVGPINCVGLPLEPLESTTCSFTYTTQPGNVFSLNQSGTFRVTTLNAPRSRNIANTFTVPYVPVPPTASISAVTSNVTEDGAQSLSYTVTLSTPAAAPISVNFSLGGSATAGVDYAASNNPLVIATGSTTGTITLDPTADTGTEADETVTVDLIAGSGYSLGAPTSASGIITNDDLPALSINDVTLSEGNAGTSNATFTISLNQPAGPGGVTFDVGTANGTALGGSDYVASALTGQTIPTGSSTYTFTVPVNGDALNEPNETFFVNVSSLTGAALADGQGLATIVNDDALPSLSIGNVSVVEGNAGTTSAVFNVTLSAASAQAVSVNFATGNGTATDPGDYTAQNGVLNFAPGQTAQTITVMVLGDTQVEANETFTVGLGGAINATIAPATGTGTITNDDVPVTVSPSTLPGASVGVAYSQTISANGGSGSYTFAVTSGALPAGLVLTAGGTLSGTATMGGSFNFTITATDSSAAPGPYSGSRAYTLVVGAPTLVLPSTTLADALRNQAYSATLNEATGGTAPYSYLVTAGALPAGLVLNPTTRVISGTPTVLGTFNFTVTATDSSGGAGPYTASRAFSVTVNDQAPVANAVSVTVAYASAANPITLNISGGTATSVAVAAGAANGTTAVSGTSISYQPNANFSGNDSFTYTASNGSGTSAPATVTVTVTDPTITVAAGGPLTATVGATYTQTFTWTGGATPFSGYQVTNLPTGLSITSSGANSVTVSGTPTQAGSFNLNASATDSSTGNGPFTVGQVFTLTVASPTVALAPGATTFPATYNVAYSQAFTASGGTGPYSYALTGTLPAGVSFIGSTLSGTPTAPGSYSFTVTATDSSTGVGAPFTASHSYTLTVAVPTIAIAPASLPASDAGVAYSGTLSASGGAAPYAYALTAGALPPGLVLTGDAVSGTPTASGTYNFTVTASDANGQTGSRAYTLTVGVPTLSLSPGTLPAGTAGSAYSQTLTASGGIAPYTVTQSGALPAGLSFNTGTLSFSGTPTEAGTFNVSVTVTDSTGGTPATLTNNYTLTIASPTLALAPAATTFAATYNIAYSQAFTASGGTGPYSYALIGTLPAGVAFGGNTLSGTPTAPGSYTFTVTATDTGSTGAGAPFRVSQAYTLTVSVPTVVVAPASLPAPDAGVAYSATLTASGGAAPYAYALSAGALPTGLTLAGGVISGTPTASGSFNFTVTATDANGQTGAATYALDVSVPTLDLTPGTLPAGIAGNAYSQTLTVSGGIAPYTVTQSGALPTGLSFNTGTLTFSGTPTEAGTFNVTVTVTDSTGGTPATLTRNYTLTIGSPNLVLSPGSLPAGTAGTAYSQQFTASGGIAPYLYAVGTGSLPAGLSLSADGLLSGTPTVAGSFTFTVTATDSTTGTAGSAAQSYTLVLAAPTLVITPVTVPNAVRGVAYSQTLSASGGTAAYTFAVTAGTLPAGITLSAAGVLSGTPTAGASSNFTATATDALGFSASQGYTLVVAEAAPIANADAATTLGVTATTIAVTENDTGVIDSIAVTTAPENGAVVVAGLTAVYTANADFSGTDTFSYTATGAGGTSTPALVTVTVNPVPVAVSRTVAAASGLPITVELTEGASGGPFTAATLVALSPAASGTATIAQVGTGDSAIHRLTYTPLATFAGVATVTFTLDNAFATSAEAVITFNVAPRPDPTQDAEVRGLLNAQVASTRRFATSQMNNFQQRLERLHGANERNGFDNGLSVSTGAERCEERVGVIPGRTCDRNGTGDEFDGGSGPAGSGLHGTSTNASGNTGAGGTAFGVWAGGMIRSGNQDGRNGSATVDFETDGVSFGADYRFNAAFVLGAGLGYGRDDSDIGDHGTRSEGDAFTLAAYASYSPGDRFFLDGLVGYQQLNYDLRRYVTVNANTVEGSREGDQWFASVSGGADLRNGDWQFTPYARVDVAQATLDGYTESGDPLYALTYGDLDVDTTTGNLGVRVDYRIRTGWGLFSPQLRLEYQHDFQGNGAATMQYADFLTGPVYRTGLDDFDRNRVNVGLGGMFGFDTWSMRLEYRGLIGSGGDSDHGVLLNIEKRL